MALQHCAAMAIELIGHEVIERLQQLDGCTALGQSTGSFQPENAASNAGNAGAAAVRLQDVGDILDGSDREHPPELSSRYVGHPGAGPRGNDQLVEMDTPAGIEQYLLFGELQRLYTHSGKKLDPVVIEPVPGVQWQCILLDFARQQPRKIYPVVGAFRLPGDNRNLRLRRMLAGGVGRGYAGDAASDDHDMQMSDIPSLRSSRRCDLRELLALRVADGTFFRDGVFMVQVSADGAAPCR